MENCISRTRRGHFFAFEEGIKTKTSLEKGSVRRDLDMVTSWTNTKLYSIKKYSKTLALLQTRMWWRDLF